MEYTEYDILLVYREDAELDRFRTKEIIASDTTITYGKYQTTVDNWEMHGCREKRVYHHQKLVYENDVYNTAGMRVNAIHFLSGGYSVDTLNYLMSRVYPKGE